MKKLAIITTHPIQYYAPLFKLLSAQAEIKLKVFYTWGESSVQKFDPGFGKAVSWDIPLLDGYSYTFLKNTAEDQGSHHRNGIINPSLINELKEFAPNAILVYGYAYQSHFRVMQHFKGTVPIWFRGDSTLLDEKWGVKSILKWFYLQWVYRHVNRAFYVGQNNKNYFKKYGLKETQLTFAPHAIDNHRFGEDRKIAADGLRNQLNIKPEEILVLFAGKLEVKKAPELLLDAFLELNPAGVHLIFVGNGLLEESLKQKVEGLQVESLKQKVESLKQVESSKRQVEGLTPNKQALLGIHFMDFQNQSQMPVVYQACDLFCLPSGGPGETWGLAVNEAMAAAKAILVSDQVGCAKDLVTESNGAIFKAGDLKDLKDKLRLLLSLNLNKLGESSKEIIQDWSFQKQVDIFTKELSQL